MLWVAAAFAVGSIPFSYLFVRWRTGQDLLRFGSRNPGATNALRAAGPLIGLSGLVLDVAKGFLPVWLVRQEALSAATVATVALACVLGHVYSPFLGFRGGKGVATGFGAASALNPFAGLLALPVFAATVALTRIVSVGSIVATAALPIIWKLVALSGYQPASGRAGWWAVVGICLLIISRHHDNWRRLRTGTEATLGGPAA